MKRALLVGAVVAAGLLGWSGVRQATLDGGELVVALGCGACHAGMPDGEAIRSAAPAFGEGTREMAPAYVFHYLADPRTVQPDIAPARMPSYDLDERQRVALALFVTNDREMRGVDDAFRAAMGRHADAGREEGRALFEAMNCAGCHLHPEAVSRTAAPDLSRTALRVRGNWLAGYLADPVTIRPAGPQPGRGGQMPDFRLSQAEVTAIAGFLLGLDGAAAQAPPATAPPEWEPLALSQFAMQKAETCCVTAGAVWAATSSATTAAASVPAWTALPSGCGPSTCGPSSTTLLPSRPAPSCPPRWSSPTDWT